MQNDIPDYLLRAIFAQASIFLKQVESPYEQYIKVMPVHTLFEKSWPWARSASQEVLFHADEPIILRIQALQVLQLYYFSQGEIQRAIVHASLAYQLSQLLSYDRLYEDVASPSTSLTM
jgi:nitric oxide reductase activation protein